MQDALMQHQIELERLFNKNQTLARVEQEFRECTDPDFKAGFEQCGIPEKFGFALLTQLALHRRADLTTMVGLLPLLLR